MSHLHHKILYFSISIYYRIALLFILEKEIRIPILYPIDAHPRLIHNLNYNKIILLRKKKVVACSTILHNLHIKQFPFFAYKLFHRSIYIYNILLYTQTFSIFLFCFFVFYFYIFILKKKKKDIPQTCNVFMEYI